MAEPILVWPAGAPGSEDWSIAESKWVNPMDGAKVLRNVSQPTLTPYIPDPATATGAGIVVCPGGAHTILAYEHEGSQVAEWLAERGIAAFVLHYRVRQMPEDDEEFHRKMRADMADPAGFQELIREIKRLSVLDGQEAIRIVRRRAVEWGVRLDRIGIMGFSAGGYVSMGVVYDHDAESRPDFAAPIYPAWPEGVVPADAPALFLACAANDDMAVRSSLPVFTAWRDAGHPVELHIFAQGGHGFGMRKQGKPSDHWIELLGNWLVGQGLTAK